jgi:GNAT superfamily N-acetyltransferase
VPTAQRPEPPAHLLRRAVEEDAGELLTLQRAAFVSEAQQYGDPLLPPLREGADQVRSAVADRRCTYLVVEATVDGRHGRAGRLLGSAQLWVDPGPSAGRPDGPSGASLLAGQVSRVVVVPDLHGSGLGSVLLAALHAAAEADGRLHRLELFTGADSVRNLAFYRRHGYHEAEVRHDDRGVRLQVMHRQLAAPTT